MTLGQCDMQNVNTFGIGLCIVCILNQEMLGHGGYAMYFTLFSF